MTKRQQRQKTPAEKDSNSKKPAEKDSNSKKPAEKDSKAKAAPMKAIQREKAGCPKGSRLSSR